MSTITKAADATTLVLNGRIYSNFEEGDVITLAPVNELTSHTNGSNGSVTIAGRTDGGVHDLTIRVTRHSDDDIELNSAINQSIPVVFNGSMKTNYRKDGVDSVDTWSLENGSIFTRPTDTKNDQDGNSLMEYVLRFRNAVRAS